MLDSFNDESTNEQGNTSQTKANETSQIPNQNENESPIVSDGIKSEETKSVVQPKKSGEKYIRIRFQAKSHPNDTEDVPLGVNGEILNIQREKEVVIPERFVEVAQHAEQVYYKTVPGEKRKVPTKVITYPYTILGEASEADYLNLKREGNRIAREAQA